MSNLQSSWPASTAKTLVGAACAELLRPDVVGLDLGYPREVNGENIAQFTPTIPPSFALGI
jgi:hypothetical protein